MNCFPMVPLASNALGLSWPTLEFAGVDTEPDIPPEPCCLTEYFSDMVKVKNDDGVPGVEKEWFKDELSHSNFTKCNCRKDNFIHHATNE